MSPHRFLRCMVGLNLAVIGFSILLGLFKTGNPSRYFGEGRYTTFFSAAQLLTIGIFSGLTFNQRNRRPASCTESAPLRRGPHFIWLLMAAGFVFVAADEIFEIHERMDHWIIGGLGLARTPLTGRLDETLWLRPVLRERTGSAARLIEKGVVCWLHGNRGLLPGKPIRTFGEGRGVPAGRTK